MLLKNVQQSLSKAIWFFCDLAGVFSKQDFAGSPKHTKKHYCIVLNHLIMAIMFNKQQQKMGLLAKLSEDMVARKTCHHEHWHFRNKFCKFFNDQENHLKDMFQNLWCHHRHC